MMQSSASPETFGTVLREYRLAAGLSQQMLAEQARISTHAVGALERGTRKLPQRQTLALLIEALQLEENERARLSLAAARPAQPRRRLELTRFGGWDADLQRSHVNGEQMQLLTRSPDAVETLGYICDRLDDIWSAMESAAARTRLIGLRQRRPARRTVSSSSRRRSRARRTPQDASPDDS